MKIQLKIKLEANYLSQNRQYINLVILMNRIICNTLLTICQKRIKRFRLLRQQLMENFMILYLQTSCGPFCGPWRSNRAWRTDYFIKCRSNYNFIIINTKLNVKHIFVVYVCFCRVILYTSIHGNIILRPPLIMYTRH